MGQYGVWPICIIILLTSLAKCSISLPINDQVPEEPRPWLNNLTEYDTARYVGRTLKAINWDSCEFGDTLDPYDESCPNGATGILPCNPGQLKIAECIGQDGDRSRMCDPCPQKFYQSFYNRCTTCHRCSECGPNEQIRQPCTDERDTACESIIPPDPVPTTTPKPKSTPPSPASAQSSTYTPGTTTDVSLAETKSTSALTYMNADTTQVQVLSTTQAEKIEPIATSKGIDSSALAISATVLFVFLLVVVGILIAINRKQRVKIIEQKRELRSCTCKSSGNNMPMKKGDSGLPSSSAPSNVNTPDNEYVCQVELDQCEDSGQMQRTGQSQGQGRPLVQVVADNESDKGSLPSKMERQEAVQSSVGVDGNESECNMESHDKIVPDRINLSNADLCRDGNGGGDHGERDIDNRPHEGGRDQDSEPNRTTVLADIHIPPENVHDTDTHRDTPSTPKPSPNYENLNGTNQTNMGAPSTSGGSGSEDSDRSRATGPEQDDGGAIADPPKTLHSTTPRPKQEGLHEADPLMQQQAGPEVVTKMKKEQKRKGIMGSLIPGRKMLKNLYSAVPPEDSPLSSKADEMVSEEFLDDLADHIDLKTLDKLCRQIGLSDKDVSNMRITYQQEHGRELAFKMFMSIRATISISFTYRSTIRAMMRSRNSHLVEKIIGKYSLR